MPRTVVEIILCCIFLFLSLMAISFHRLKKTHYEQFSSLEEMRVKKTFPLFCVLQGKDPFHCFTLPFSPRPVIGVTRKIGNEKRPRINRHVCLRFERMMCFCFCKRKRFSWVLKGEIGGWKTGSIQVEWNDEGSCFSPLHVWQHDHHEEKSRVGRRLIIPDK